MKEDVLKKANELTGKIATLNDRLIQIGKIEAKLASYPKGNGEISGYNLEHAYSDKVKIEFDSYYFRGTGSVEYFELKELTPIRVLAMEKKEVQIKRNQLLAELKKL